MRVAVCIAVVKMTVMVFIVGLETKVDVFLADIEIIILVCIAGVDLNVDVYIARVEITVVVCISVEESLVLDCFVVCIDEMNVIVFIPVVAIKDGDITTFVILTGISDIRSLIVVVTSIFVLAAVGMDVVVSIVGNEMIVLVCIAGVDMKAGVCMAGVEMNILVCIAVVEMIIVVGNAGVEMIILVFIACV